MKSRVESTTRATSLNLAHLSRVSRRAHAGLIDGPPTNHYWAVRNPPAGYQTVSPYLLYEDAPRAIEHLKSAFGFEERLSQTGAGGRSHTELILGDDGLVMIGQAWDGFSSPRSLGAHPPSLIHVYVSDVDALHERAKAAGADVTDLELAPVGDRRFTATDPEGQVWVFAQRVTGPAS